MHHYKKNVLREKIF